MRVLVVEDEPKMARLILRALEELGAVTDHAERGDDAVVRAATGTFDVILLDVMLPGIDGFEVARQLRAEEIWTPILMLTARDAVADRVGGLDSGADDYLLKPFAVDELLARVRALARRGAAPRPAVLTAGDLRLDPAAVQAWRGDTPLDLSAKEFTILEAFLRRPGETLSRDQLLQLAWDHAYENRSNVVDVYVRYLREKIDRPFGRSSLETVRGHGYRVVDDRPDPAQDRGGRDPGGHTLQSSPDSAGDGPA